MRPHWARSLRNIVFLLVPFFLSFLSMFMYPSPLLCLCQIKLQGPFIASLRRKTANGNHLWVGNDFLALYHHHHEEVRAKGCGKANLARGTLSSCFFPPPRRAHGGAQRSPNRRDQILCLSFSFSLFYPLSLFPLFFFLVFFCFYKDFFPSFIFLFVYNNKLFPKWGRQKLKSGPHIFGITNMSLDL